MPTLIQTWNVPHDPGGGNPEREYFSPLIGGGWTHLAAVINSTTSWPGSFRITPPDTGDVWFNTVIGAGSNSFASPHQANVTTPSSQMELTTNSTPPVGPWSVQLFGDLAVPGSFCTFGSRPKPASPAIQVIDQVTVLAYLTTLGMEWLFPVFFGFYGGTINVAQLCAAPPPVPGPIDLSTLDASVLTLGELLKAIEWPNLCECIPGTPTPVPYPLPTQPEPPGWPTSSPIACSNTDICTTLVGMARQLNQLQAAMSSTLELVTLEQRYGLPFAYIRGATHANAAGPGGFSVSRLLGIDAVATFPDEGHPVLEGNPPYQMSKSWMSITNHDGLLAEKRLVRRSTIWLPKEMAEATQLNFSLEPGVTVDFTELQAEP